MKAIPAGSDQEVLGESNEYTVLKSKSIFSPTEKNKLNIDCEPESEKNIVNTGININDANLTDPRVTQLQTPLKKNDKLVSKVNPKFLKQVN